MNGKIEYYNQTIRVTKQKKTLTIQDIQLLFIENNLSGNSIYIETGLDSLWGYGEISDSS